MSFQERVIESLKRRYATPVEYYHQNETITDLARGTITAPFRLTTYIRQGILLPMSASRDFVYDLTFLAAAKNFVYGGFFDTGQRILLVSKRDLTRTLYLGDYTVIRGKRYDVQSFEEYDATYVLVVKAVEGNTNHQVHTFNLRSRLGVTHEQELA